MANPFDAPLPSVGQKPWTLNPAIIEMRGRQGTVEDVINTGRLSPSGLADEIAEAAASVEVNDATVASAVSNPTSDTNAALVDQIADSGTPVGAQLSNAFARGLSVAAFGATGNGTTDDTGAIHAARDAAAGLGSDLWFPAGTYKTSGLINSAPGQMWRLESGAKITGTSVARLITLSGNGAGVLGGSVEGGTTAGIFVASGVVGAIVEAVTFPNPVSAVRVKQATGTESSVTVRNCNIANSSAHAIWLNWEASNSVIEGNTITGTAADANGIWVGNGSTNVTARGNRIYAPTDMGIEFWTGCDGGLIEGNIIQAPVNMGISVDKSARVKVINNRVLSPGSHGIECAGMLDGLVSENTIKGTDGRTNPNARAVAINSTSTYDNTGLSVINNVIVDSVAQAIHASGTGGTSDRVAISGNKIRNTGSTAIKSDPGRGANWIISNNYIYQETTAYTAIDPSGGDAVVSGNIVEYSAGITTAASAAVLLAATNYTVTGNKIRGNGKVNVGITCNSGVAGSLINGNLIDGTVQNMVLATSVTALDVVVSNNRGTKSAGSGFNLGTAATAFNNQDGTAGANSTYVGITGSTLPSAGSAYRGQVRMVRGAAGVADVAYVCMKDAADNYSWKVLTLI